ncbi:uncharacterized protein LOC116842059 isoform X1 [Odontomachus brunneus]|uniref:uncharacterized protein LOC116842059 isoform X1 n=1 Tax=Odontomachus brunneus TaxID=486640 RepID=UPI0013F27164|nr:uncharacterized protein LOC116842059 isoform X1 [Odontomachus brunneus]
MCDRQKGTICVVKIETTGKLLYSSVHEHVIGSSNSDRVTAKITCMFVEFYHQENVSELFCKHECTLHLQHNRGITTEARCFSIRVWKVRLENWPEMAGMEIATVTRSARFREESCSFDSRGCRTGGTGSGRAVSAGRFEVKHSRPQLQVVSSE